SLMHTMVLQCADHLQSGAIADVSEPWITMSTEISLEDAPVFCAIKNGAPGFELAHSIGRFLRVQFCHSPLIDVLTAAHGIGEVHLPIVAFIDVGQRRCDSALSPHRLPLTHNTFAHDSNPNLP